MTEVVLVPDHFYNCPICGQACKVEKEESYRTPIAVQGSCQLFICYNPLATNPLHYYSHIVENSFPHRIAFQEFSLDLGNKYVLFANNYKQQKTIIKNNRNATALELNFVIVPDFPNLISLTKKVRTSITFS